MPSPTVLRRRAISGPRTSAALAVGSLAAVACTAAVAAGGATAAPAPAPVRDQAMTRQLPQDITVAVRGRTVTVHFGSLRRRATRTATIRFTRPGDASVVRRRPASGTLRLTAPKGSSRVRVSVPRTQEWTPTTITRSIRR